MRSIFLDYYRWTGAWPASVNMWQRKCWNHLHLLSRSWPCICQQQYHLFDHIYCKKFKQFWPGVWIFRLRFLSWLTWGPILKILVSVLYFSKRYLVARILGFCFLGGAKMTVLILNLLSMAWYLHWLWSEASIKSVNQLQVPFSQLMWCVKKYLPSSGFPFLWLWIQGNMWVETKNQELDRGRKHDTHLLEQRLVQLSTRLSLFFLNHNFSDFTRHTFRVLYPAVSTTGTTRIQ